MALAFQLRAAGYTPTKLRTEAAVSLDPEAADFRITHSAPTLRARVPNLSDATFVEFAKQAELNCPVSRVLKASITLNAQLV
jgi:osmotically inducible protein OsmC